MIGLILNVVTGPQKLLWIAGAIAIGITSFWTWLKIHDHNIREEAILEFNMAQEKILADKKAEFERKIEEIKKEADTLRQEYKEKEDKLRQTVSDIEKSIEAKGGNRPAPKYIREVIDKMNKSFAEPSR